MTKGNVVPVEDIDIRSAYPAAFSSLGCWDILRAARLSEVDTVAELRILASLAASGDLAPLFDPGTYRRMGLCLAGVRFDGEYGPVELPGGPGQLPSFHIARMRSDTPLPVTWPDVVLSAMLSHRVPRIQSAIRLAPVGTEQTRSIPLRDGLVIHPADDPVAAGVRRRSVAKDAGDRRLPVVLRVDLNAMGWGQMARLDQRRVAGRLIETPSTWTWPPIASTVPACSRMWLAMVDRMVSDLGGAIVTRDTDGLAIVALPDGGSITLSDGTTVRALSWAQIDALLAPFDALNPFGDRRPFWDVKRGTEDQPLHILSLGQKRYVKAQRGPDGWEAVGGTEHSLGGGVVDPPAMVGRDAGRRHVWTYPVADHALARATAMAAGQPCPGFEAPWDGSEAPPFPVLRQYMAASPTTLGELPGALGAHPFAPIVEAHPDQLLARHAETPVALDPGTNLAEWATLQWHDRHGPDPCYDNRHLRRTYRAASNPTELRRGLDQAPGTK